MDAPGMFLWDWNGTLVNDVALCSQLLNSQLQRHGHAPLGGVEEYRRVFRFPIEDYKDAGFDFARCSYRQLAAEYMSALPLPACWNAPCSRTPGRCWQRWQRGARQVVLSASEQAMLDEQLAHFGLMGYFEEVLGQSDFYGHSKVQRGLAWLAASGLEKERAVMVGDTDHDFEVAAALGIRCVLFAGGHQPREKVGRHRRAGDRRPAPAAGAVTGRRPLPPESLLPCRGKRGAFFCFVQAPPHWRKTMQTAPRRPRCPAGPRRRTRSGVELHAPTAEMCGAGFDDAALAEGRGLKAWRRRFHRLMVA